MTTTSDTRVLDQLRVAGVSKAYGKVPALKDVSLTVPRGTVHGLIGENGSGKSTLSKIVAGSETPDAGTVSVGESDLQDFTPRESLHAGVRMIYQDLALFPSLSVAENISFSGDRPLLSFRSPAAAHARADAALTDLGLDIDPRQELGRLPAGQRQLVAIARAVSSDGRLIMMDEPTAALTHGEIDRLLETVATLRARGISFVFVSHKLREVSAIADGLTVLRNGEVVSTGPAAEYDEQRMTELMVGGDVRAHAREEILDRTKPPALRLRRASLGDRFSDVDLEVRRGQVLGLAGLVGSGRTEIGLAIAQLIHLAKGSVTVDGRRVPPRGSRIQYVPEDRLTEGLILDWTIADNIATQSLTPLGGTGHWVAQSRLLDLARTWAERLRIKTPTVEAPVSSLSGGNQQRVLLARALATEPEVLVLNNPTVGVDIGSRAEIHALIKSLADSGMAIVVISDEPAELISVCDDIAIVRRGRVVQSLLNDGLDDDVIWNAMLKSDRERVPA